MLSLRPFKVLSPFLSTMVTPDLELLPLWGCWVSCWDSQKMPITASDCHRLVHERDV